MPSAKLKVRIQRAEKLSAGTPQNEPGLSAPQLKLRKLAPSSRTFTGLPERVWLLKYSPFQWSADTLAMHTTSTSMRILETDAFALKVVFGPAPPPRFILT